jgi:hypothetical protein
MHPAKFLSRSRRDFLQAAHDSWASVITERLSFTFTRMVCMALVIVSATGLARAAGGLVLQSSDFDFDDNGWLFENTLQIPGPPVFEGEGGAPRGKGGFIRTPTGVLGTFIPPSQFRGDLVDAYGGALTFYGRFIAQCIVELTFGETQLFSTVNLDPNATTNWYLVRVPFEASAWYYDGGATVSPEEFACLLRQVDGIRILLVTETGLPGGHLDRVTLLAPKGVAKGKAKPSPLDFGDVLVGTTVTNILTVTNGGAFGKTRVLRLQFNDVPENIEIIPLTEFCGFVLPGQAIQFQVIFTATTATQYNETITLSTGTSAKPRFTRLKVRAKTVTSGGSIAGTWSRFGYAQFPVVITSVGANVYEAAWTDFDIDQTRHVLRGKFNGITWKGTWTWTAGDFSERGTFTVTHSTGEGAEFLDGSAHSKQGAITIGFVRPPYR